MNKYLKNKLSFYYKVVNDILLYTRYNLKNENCNYEQAFLKLRQTFYYKVMNDILLYTNYKLKLKKLKLQTQHFKEN